MTMPFREEAAGRAARGAGGEAGRWQADGGREPGAERAEDQAYRAALDKLEAKRTALIVESGAVAERDAVSWASRNLEGVELMLNNEVHPYDLLALRARDLLARGD